MSKANGSLGENMPESASSTRQAVPPYLGKKLTGLSFFAIVAVVFIHAYNYTDTFLTPATTITEGLHVGAMIQYFVSNALARFATPLFFCISGYLFFVAFRRFTFKGYLRKLGKRAYTLLVPYLFWVGLWTGIAALLVTTAGWDAFPILSGKVGGLFGGEWWRIFTDPVVFQAWYLKDLFKLAVLSPIVYLAVKYLRWGAPLLAAIPWVLDYTLPYMPNCDGLLFFTLGAYFAVRGVVLPGMNAPVRDKRILVALPCVWASLCIAYTVLAAVGKRLGVPSLLMLAMYKLCAASGVCAVYVLYDALSDKLTQSKLFAVAATEHFFVYILHEPLQHMAYESALSACSADWVHMLCYAGLPVFFVAAGVALSFGIRKLSPKLHSFLTGNR